MIFFIICVMSCTTHNKEELALVNGNEITLNDFLPKYKRFLSKTHQNDNLSNRYAFLNSMIDESIILQHAKIIGLDSETEMLHQKEKIHDQLLLNEYYDTEVADDAVNVATSAVVIVPAVLLLAAILTVS